MFIALMAIIGAMWAATAIVGGGLAAGVVALATMGDNNKRYSASVAFDDCFRDSRELSPNVVVAPDMTSLVYSGIAPSCVNNFVRFGRANPVLDIVKVDETSIKLSGSEPAMAEIVGHIALLAGKDGRDGM
jgi:hypothetical protein